MTGKKLLWMSVLRRSMKVLAQQGSSCCSRKINVLHEHIVLAMLTNFARYRCGRDKTFMFLKNYFLNGHNI